MIIYSKKPETLRYIYKNIPSFLKCDKIVRNQIYYSYQLLRKKYKYTSEILNELRCNARVCGTLDEVNDLHDVFSTYSLNDILTYKVGFKPTYLNAERLRHLIKEELDLC